MSKTYGTPGPRALHPSYATSRSLARCSTLARLLFGCMIASADDQGRLCGDAIDLRDLFRLSSESQEATTAALAQLAEADVVRLYEADGQPLVQVVSWWSWQSSQRRAYPSRYPAPAGWQDVLYGYEGHPSSFAAARGELPQIAAERGELPPNAASRAGACASALPVPVPVPMPVPVPEATGTDQEHDAGKTLRRRQSWSTWGPEWNAVKAAWIRRGFRMPPTGEQDEAGTQRAILFEVFDNRPDDLARWIAEAPGKDTHAVVAYVLARWHEIKDDAGGKEHF